MKASLQRKAKLRPCRRKVSAVFTDAELKTILHYMAIALRHGRGAFRPVEQHCCRDNEEWIPVLRKAERYLGIASTWGPQCERGPTRPL